MTRFVARAASGAWLLAVFLGLAVAVPGAAEVPVSGPVIERGETDVLLLAVKLDQSLLAEALPTYQVQGRVFLPLGEMCRLLGLGISVDVPRGLASGFFITPKRLFELDLGARKILVEGKARRFDPAAIEAHHDDIYVDVALFSEWLPLRLDVDFLGSAITVFPREPLPLQLRLERERKLSQVQTGPSPGLSHYPKIELPYKLFDGPFVDETLQWTRTATSQGSQNTLDYSTFATGDFLFAEASAFVSGTDQGIADSRFSLSRKDPEGNLLGFLGAREVTVGDVFHPGLGLVALPSSGPGLLVSNYPLQLPAQFDRQSFRGDLSPGWEVELYRGAELLAYSQSRPDGLYEFLDVPLLFGLNAFRLELYGPQGEHRTETQTLNVGDSLTPKGEVYYRLAGNDPRVRLLGTGPPAVGTRSTLEVSAGLTRNLSASVSGGSVDLLSGRHTYGEAGLRAFWGWLFANVDVAKDHNGGAAWQATLSSRFGAFGLRLQHAELDRFTSEAFASSIPLQSRTTLRLDTAVPETFLPRLPLLVEVNQDQLENGQRRDQITSRFSAFSHGFSVSNQLSWAFAPGGGAQPPSNAIGHVLISKYLQKFALRGEIDYEMKPAREVTGMLLTAETRLVRRLLLTVGINRMFLARQTQLHLGVNKLEGRFGYGLTADYSRPGGLSGRLIFSLSAGRDTRTGAWYTQGRPLASLGGVSGRAFLDTNGNGRLDEGEALIPGAGFLINGAGNLVRTDEKGEAFIPNLPPYQDLDFSLAAGTLEDPFWKPARAGVRFVPRPGKVALVDFPVEIFGEITGSIYLRRNGANLETSGVELELVNPQGAVIKKVLSAYDGFYDVTEIKPGHYRLRVAESQLAELHFLAPPAREVEMAPSGTVLDGVNFVLAERPPG